LVGRFFKVIFLPSCTYGVWDGMRITGVAWVGKILEELIPGK